MVYGGLDQDHLYPIYNTRPNPLAVFPLLEGYFDGGVAIVLGLPDNSIGFSQIIAWEGVGTTNGWQTASAIMRSPVFGILAFISFDSGLTLAIPKIRLAD